MRARAVGCLRYLLPQRTFSLGPLALDSRWFATVIDVDVNGLLINRSHKCHWIDDAFVYCRERFGGRDRTTLCVGDMQQGGRLSWSQQSWISPQNSGETSLVAAGSSTFANANTGARSSPPEREVGLVLSSHPPAKAL